MKRFDSAFRTNTSLLRLLKAIQTSHGSDFLHDTAKAMFFVQASKIPLYTKVLTFF